MTYEVTIGIPVFNVERYIRMTMDSALAQTFENIEFLVLDDCGTDSSMDIVHEYQHTHPRGKDIHIVRQPQNMGIGCARNRIIEEAQGRFLYQLDADDTIDPDTITLLYESAQRYNADIVYGSYERIEVFDGTTKNTVYSYPSMQFLREHEFADRVYNEYGFLQAQTWNFLILREIYLKNNIRYKAANYWEDFAMTIDLPTYITRAVLLPNVTYYYYCRYGSLSNYDNRAYIDKFEILKTIDVMAWVKQSSDRVKSKPYFHKRMYNVMLTHFYMVCAIMRNRKKIIPTITNREIRDVMRSPLTFCETLSLKGWKFKNLFLFMIGIMPSSLSVALIYLLGKSRKLL